MSERKGMRYHKGLMDAPYQRIALPNGVRLLLVPMPGINSVATSVMVGVGSRYEDRSINGISHFLEHMVFKGTEKYPTTDEVNIIERQGGLQNAYTDIDVTNYHNKVLASEWELGLEINKELAIRPLLEERYVEKERNVILEEMKRYDDEPAAKVEELYHTMLYRGTKLGMRIIGEVESLRAIDANALRSYHARWYTPNRIVVVVAGAIGGQEQAIQDRVMQWFGSLPVSSDQSDGIEYVTDTQREPRFEVIVKPDAQQAHIELGVRIFPRGSEERFAWSVFNLLMGVSFTSRLFREIREKRGLCYHIRSSSDQWVDVGTWSIYAGVATERAKEAVQAIIDELRKVVQDGVTEEEVAIAKKRLKTMIAFQSEDPEFQNEYYGRQEVFNQELLTLEEYLKKIESVTKEDINRLTRRYIVTNTLNLALVWSGGDTKGMVEMLTI
ncbi:MAG: pitrilysin family protein [Candidatus Methanomethylicaceae archaeon]